MRTKFLRKSCRSPMNTPTVYSGGLVLPLAEKRRTFSLTRVLMTSGSFQQLRLTGGGSLRI